MILTFISITIILIYLFIYLKNPRLSILGIILLLPLYIIRLDIFYIPTTFLELILISVFIGFFYKLIRTRFDFKFYGFFIPLLILLISAIISTKISNHSIPAIGILKAYIIEPILFFIVFINTFKTKKELELIIKTIGISSLIISLYAIFQKITGLGIGLDDPSWSKEETRRVTSIFPYPNAVGLFLAPIVTIFLFRIIEKTKNLYPQIGEKPKTKIDIMNLIKINFFNLFVFINGLLAIIFARSSGALMGIISSFILFLFINSKNKFRVFLIGFISFVLIISLPFIYPITNKTILLGDFSGKIRVQMWEETALMIKNNFIYGGGLNNFKEALKPYHEKTFFELYLYPHNIILNFWSELGLFGLISFVLILYIFFRDNYKIYTEKIENIWIENSNEKQKTLINYKKENSLIFSLAMFCLLVHGLVDVPYFKNDLSILFFIIISLGIINNRIENNIVIRK